VVEAIIGNWIGQDAFIKEKEIENNKKEQYKNKKKNKKKERKKEIEKNNKNRSTCAMVSVHILSCNLTSQ